MQLVLTKLMLLVNRSVYAIVQLSNKTSYRKILSTFLMTTNKTILSNVLLEAKLQYHFAHYFYWIVNFTRQCDLHKGWYTFHDIANGEHWIC